MHIQQQNWKTTRSLWPLVEAHCLHAAFLSGNTGQVRYKTQANVRRSLVFFRRRSMCRENRINSVDIERFFPERLNNFIRNWRNIPVYRNETSIQNAYNSLKFPSVCCLDIEYLRFLIHSVGQFCNEYWLLIDFGHSWTIGQHPLTNLVNEHESYNDIH